MNKNIKIFQWVLISILLLNTSQHFLTDFRFTIIVSLLLISIVGTIFFSSYKNLREDRKSKLN